MSFFVEFCIFTIGFTSLVGGLLALHNPRNQCKLRGIPDMRSSEDPASFALIYMLAARDISFGIFILAHQFQYNHIAIATVMAVMSFMKFGDLLTVLAELAIWAGWYTFAKTNSGILREDIR
ncbi:hypothetical protein FOBRF1_012712 [Fusarium oxysporum]